MIKEANMRNVCPCLKNELLREYNKIKEIHDKKITKSFRLRTLAEPKIPYKPDTIILPCNNSKSNISKIELLNLEDPINTRLEQLSLPRVRNLTSLCGDKCFKKLAPHQQEAVNRTMRKSFLSMYSRLSHVENPFIKTKVLTLSPEERKRHRERMARLARPVKTKHVKMENKVQLSDRPIYRYKILAKPRSYEPEPAPIEWHLTNGLRKFEPTPRLRQLAEPKMPKTPEEPQHHIRNLTLKEFKGNRFLTLSKPRRIYQRASVHVIKIPSSALRALPTKRILDLAQPRIYDTDTGIRKKITRIPRKILKTEPTERIKFLAKPRAVHFKPIPKPRH